MYIYIKRIKFGFMEFLKNRILPTKLIIYFIFLPVILMAETTEYLIITSATLKEYFPDSGTVLGSKSQDPMTKIRDFRDFSEKSPSLKSHNFRATEPFLKSRHSRIIY